MSACENTPKYAPMSFVWVCASIHLGARSVSRTRQKKDFITRIIIIALFDMVITFVYVCLKLSTNKGIEKAEESP